MSKLLWIFFLTWLPTHADDISFVEVSNTNLPTALLNDNSMDLVAYDLDGDKDLDLVIAVEKKPNLILINDGTGKFTPGKLPQKFHDSEDIAVEDFDNDGDPDIIFVSEDDAVHEYYLNDGKANFTDVSNRIPVQSTCNAVVAADFDGDGDKDLILGNDGQDIFLANDGKGNFTDETLKRMPRDINTTQDVEAIDIDNDGDADLVFGNEDGNKIYINDGKGFFKDETKERLPEANKETRKVDFADIDNDGDIDLFFSNVDFTRSKEIGNQVLVNTGKGFFKDETSIRYKALNSFHSCDVSFSDLNNDGFVDMVVGNVMFGYAQVCMNNGKGIFIETDKMFPQQVTGEAISVEVADLNGDGLPDIYFGMFRGQDRLFFGKK